MSALLIGLAAEAVSEQELEWLQLPQVAGVVLFKRNIHDTAQLRRLTDRIRAIDPQLLVCIDQEGGRVQRVREPLTCLPPLRHLGRCLDIDAALAHRAAAAHAWLMAREILTMGIDLSFTPVLDLDGDSNVIGDRAFDSEPDRLIALARTYLEAMHEAGIATCGKHFPGHGTVVADTHHEAAVDARSIAVIEQHDLVPFVALAEHLDAVMMAHVCYPEVCPQAAGYSAVWISDWLRQRCQFAGVVFSDDLGMRAAEQVGGFRQRIEASVRAGCDLILICDPEAVEAALQDLPELEGSASAGRSLQATHYPHWEELESDSRRIAHQQTLLDLAAALDSHDDEPGRCV